VERREKGDGRGKREEGSGEPRVKRRGKREKRGTPGNFPSQLIINNYPLIIDYSFSLYQKL
jgi:hypothetical protein